MSHSLTQLGKLDLHFEPTINALRELDCAEKPSTGCFVRYLTARSAGFATIRRCDGQSVLPVCEKIESTALQTGRTNLPGLYQYTSVGDWLVVSIVAQPPSA